MLRVWLGATWLLAGLYAGLARRAHLRMGAPRERFAERLGQPSARAAGPVVWIHGASLGEVAQIGPVVEALRARQTASVLVTTATQAGADWVARRLPGVIHQFAPLDTPRAVAGFLSAWDITAAVFVEGDLWPRMGCALQARGVPRVLLNARASRTRARLAGVYGALLHDFTAVTCRSEDVAEGLRDLGLPPTRVQVLPDLRIASAKLPVDDAARAEIAGWVGPRPLWLAASTHPGDEAAVIAAQRGVTEAHPGALLILAPRHPPRADALEQMAAEAGLRVARRSQGAPVEDGTQVYLADTLGEMGTFFALAPLAFVGGSFGGDGGHNPYEPAQFGTAILAGARVANFADAYARLAQDGAAELLDDPDRLGLRVAALLGSGELAAMGQAAERFMERQAGGVEATVALIEAAMGESRR